MLLNKKKLFTVVNEDLNDGVIGDKINFQNFKKIDNSHKKASYSTAIDMKVAS
jgi:hypothetical protein